MLETLVMASSKLATGEYAAAPGNLDDRLRSNINLWRSPGGRHSAGGRASTGRRKQAALLRRRGNHEIHTHAVRVTL